MENRVRHGSTEHVFEARRTDSYSGLRGQSSAKLSCYDFVSAHARNTRANKRGICSKSMGTRESSSPPLSLVLAANRPRLAPILPGGSDMF